MSSIKISGTALNISIPSALTNEIPHLSVWDILNKHLRNTWSEDFIGKTSAKYSEEYTSTKTVNGKVSNVYKPRNLTFADPEKNIIYNADFEKIDFSVSGAFETEIDYLMHEMSRYLSKLYPDDFNTLITLTEAERQSYINEALHMVHSYFDTEQIVAFNTEAKDQEAFDLYYRNRFLTGITEIRSNTGVAQQEAQLLNLLNTGNVSGYTGFTTFIDPNGLSVVSTNLDNVGTADNIVLEGYYYLSSTEVTRQALTKLHGKIRSDSLKDFLEDSRETLAITQNFFDLNIKEFCIVKSTNPIELVDDLVNGNFLNSKDFNLNELFKSATAANLIKEGSGIENLKNTSFGERSVNLRNEDIAYLIFSQSTSKADLVAFKDSDGTPYPMINLENKIAVNNGALKDISELNVIKFGNVFYTEDFLLCLGNVIFYNIASQYQTSEAFKNYFEIAVKSSANLQSCVHIKQKGQTVFAGILNKSFFVENEIDYSSTLKALSEKSYSQKYDASNIFSYYLYKDQLSKIDINTRQEMTIEYSSLLVNSDYLHNTILINDAFNGTDFQLVVHLLANNAYALTFSYTKNKQVYTFTGDTQTGTLRSLQDKSIYYCSLEENVLKVFTKNADDEIESERSYKIPTNDTELSTYVYNEENEKVGRLVTSDIHGIGYFDYNLFLQLQTGQGLIKAGNGVVNSNFKQVLDLTFNTNFNDADPSGNTIAISVDWYTDLQSLIEDNTNKVIQVDATSTPSEEASDTEIYLYYTHLDVKSGVFREPDSEINTTNLSKKIFKRADVQYYELSTYPCYFYADNIIRIKKDITEIVNQRGRINCIILDNYKNRYPAKIYKSIVRNEYCYVSLTDNIEGISNLSNRKGYLIIDLGYKCDVQDKQLTFSRRGLENKQIYLHDNQKYIFKYTWKDLTQANLNFAFSNIYSNNVNRVYADDSKISQDTHIPTTLSELEEVTIFDSLSNDTVTEKLVKDLITENKSLYLDSTLKSLVNVPLGTKIFVFNDQYSTYSFVVTDKIPSYVTFYNFDDYELYEPLKKVLDTTTSRELTLAELQTRINRRYVVWGSVVWDANDNSKSVKTLRTIWSGYFTNFSIFTSDDLIPDEGIIYGYSDFEKLNIKTQNILNYDYANNNGNPDIDWIITVLLSKQNYSQNIVNIVDAFSHKREAIETENFKLFGDDESLKEIYLDSFTLSMNKVDLATDNMLIYKKSTSQLKKITLDDIQVGYENLDAADSTIFYNPTTKKYTYRFNKDLVGLVKGKDYNFNLLYNMLFLKDENFASVKMFSKYCHDNMALEMLLEYYTWQYYNKYGTEPVLKDGEDVVDSFIKSKLEITDEDYEQYIKYNLFCNEGADKNLETISFVDVFSEAIRSNKGFGIPTIAVINSDNTVALHYFVTAQLDEKQFKIYTGTIDEPLNGDLLNSLLTEYYKSFQVPESLFNTYANYCFKYQNLLPDNVIGIFKNFSIDIGVKKDTSVEDNQVLVVDDTITGEDRKNKENFLNHFTTVGKTFLSQQIDNYLTNIDSHSLNIEGKQLSIDDRSYSFSDKSKTFREYYYTTIQLSTDDPDTKNSIIKKCRMRFDQDFGLTNSGYVYLYDIKSPNRRTSYTANRETQIVDRSYSISDLNIIGYKVAEDNNKDIQILLQDATDNSSRKVLRAIEAINPTNGENSQKVVDDKLSLGFMWKDPGVDIGYTFYKRKFVAEAVINSIDPTMLYLADDDLNDGDFDLTKHVTVGDSIQIYMTTPSSYFQEGQTVTIGLDTEDDLYVGPYRVIYTKAATVNGTAVQHAILSGPNNIVYVKVDITNDDLKIAKPVFFNTNNTDVYAYAANGEILYYSAWDKNIYDLASIDDFIESEGSETSLKDISNPDSSAAVPTKNVDNPAVTSLEDTSDIPLDKHEEWYDFNFTSNTSETDTTDDTSDIQEDDQSAEQYQEILTLNATSPAFIQVNIPLNNGYLNFDNYDRMYYEPPEDSDEETSWKSRPDNIEMFDASGHPNAIEIIDISAGTRDIVAINEASADQLKTFIRESIVGLFDDINLSNVNLQQLAESNANQGQADTPSITLQSSGTTYTFEELEEASPADLSRDVLAKILFKKTTGSINLASDNMYIPTLQEIDIPIYANDTKPKWRRVTAITGTSETSINAATLEQLQSLAKVLLNTIYITRKAPQITSYAKNSKNVAIWDQTSSTLTISNKLGNLKKRIAISELGFMHPVLSQTLATNQLTAANAIDNRVYIKGSEDDFNNYINACNRLFNIPEATANTQVEGEEDSQQASVTTFGVYEIFERDKPLYLPTVFENITVEEAKANETFVNDGRESDVVNLLNIVKDETQYEAWLQRCKYLDFLVSDSCRFESFKDTTYAVNVNTLNYVLGTLGLTEAAYYCEQVLKTIQLDIADQVVKGLVYYTENTTDAANNKLVDTLQYFTSLSIEGNLTSTFESLINTSNIELTNNYVHIYGTVNWPAISGDQSILNNLESILLARLPTDTTVESSAKEAIINAQINEIKSNLITNYKRLNNNKDYPEEEGERNSPFKVSVDLTNYYVTTTMFENTTLENGNSVLPILSLVENSEGLTALSTTGTFNLGSEAAGLAEIDQSDVTQIAIKKGILYVYEALKTINIFGKDINVNEEGQVRVPLIGTAIPNGEIFYSIVERVFEKSLKIRDDTVLLNDGALANAIILVKSLSKDNFQLGYGAIDNFDMIPLAQTLFEVTSADYADFASYENKSSNATYDANTNMMVKDSVFDLYPTPEQIDADRLQYFYKLNEDKVTYLKNRNNRYILRVSNLYNEYGGGNIIKAVGETIANANITDTFLIDNIDNLDTYIVNENRSRFKNYSDVLDFVPQKIPALVNNPWEAILTYSYKSVDATVDTTKDNSIIVDSANNTLLVKATVSDETLVNTLSTPNAGDRKSINESQLNNISSDFVALADNIKLLNLDLKIINKTESLPYFYNITKYASRSDSDDNLVLKTNATEIYIPESGYGQSLFGTYTTPDDCNFEDGIFFDSEKKTVNENGEQFVLVNSNGEPYDSEKTNYIPKLIYKSFIQADSALDKDLPGRDENSASIQETLIDLSLFDVDTQTIMTEDKELLKQLDLLGRYKNATDEELATKATRVYNLFLDGIKFSCKMMYSKQKVNFDTTNVLCITDVQDKAYTADELLEALDCTRVYNYYSVPANYRYFASDNTYKTTTGTLLKYKDKYCADPSGHIMYMDTDGNLTTEITINDPVPAARSQNALDLFSIQNGIINTVVDSCFYLTNCVIVPSYSNKNIVVKNSSKLKTLIAAVDPNSLPSLYNFIIDVSDNYSWSIGTSLKWVFDTTNLQINLSYTEESGKQYNFAYLKDKDGKLVAKVFFKNKVNDDKILMFSKED